MLSGNKDTFTFPFAMFFSTPLQFSLVKTSVLVMENYGGRGHLAFFFILGEKGLTSHNEA